ncbi:MAG: hypothetical protein ACREEM_38560 [Blastocatellia bacterium]
MREWILTGNVGTLFSFLALVVFAGAVLFTPLIVIGLAWRERLRVQKSGEGGDGKEDGGGE